MHRNDTFLHALLLTKAFLCTVAALVASLFAGLCFADDDGRPVKIMIINMFSSEAAPFTTQLNLTPEQQAKVKPIAENEQALYEQQIHANPVLSQKEKIKRLESMVRDSDKQMRQILSPEQWQKLQLIRKEQQQELEALAR